MWNEFNELLATVQNVVCFLIKDASELPDVIKNENTLNEFKNKIFAHIKTNVEIE